ncbi:MAG TPA: hypothetical protein PLM33_04215 [Acidobacteriota bacterium]|nr:hypothetical protein [Acidobacteriota bacterium]HRR55456.1 hypothetical protein [Acidobacteriota bacterium]HRV07822.1 hypothetical protein [Acidobacteriota bacterium]
MRRSLRRFLVLSFSVLATAGVVFGSGIERYFAATQGYRYIKNFESASLDSREVLGPFNRMLLEDAGLVSFSRWEVTADSAQTMSVEVWETQDSRGAYSLFTWWLESAEHAGKPLPLGVGNRFDPTSAVFWRGNCFFHVEAPSGRLAQDDFLYFAGAIIQAINIENQLPVSVSHLPTEELDASSVRFYCGIQSLKQNSDLPPEILPLLRPDEGIEVSYAKYTPEGFPLFVIGYPTVAMAQEDLVRLQGALQSVFSEQGIYLKRSGLLIGIFLGPEEKARAVLGALQYKPTVQWLKDERSAFSDEQLTFLGLVVQSLLGTAVLLVVIALLGGGAGLVRYWLLQHFPRLGHHDEMIRLRLHD